MIELIVVLVIIGILGTAVVGTLMGSRSSDSIDRATQSIYNDLVFMRMRAVSTNLTHRIRFISTTTWQLESYNSGTATWSAIASPRNMPTSTYATSATYTNAGSNLQAQANGLYSFQGGSTGTPFVTITDGSAKSKSVVVAVGGAISIENN